MYLVKLVKLALEVEKCVNDYVLYYLSMYVPLFHLDKYSGVLGKVRIKYGLKKSVFLEMLCMVHNVLLFHFFLCRVIIFP